METIELGVTSAFDLLLFAFMFWAGTVLIQLVVLFWARGRLARAGRKTGTATLLFALIGCGLVPLAGGYVGCTFAWQRSTANAIEHVDPAQLTDLLVDHGVDELREFRRENGWPADDKSPIGDVDVVRERLRVKQDASGDGIEGFFERTWWKAVELAFSHATKDLTWGALIDRAATELKTKIRDEVGSFADGLRSSARKTLWFYLAFLVLANAIPLGFVLRAAAKPLPPAKPVA